MLEQKFLELGAMVEQFFENAKNFLPVVEMGCEPIDVYHDIDNRNTCHLVHVLV